MTDSTETAYAEVDAKLVKAALLIAAKKDIRVYLNGVYFDFPNGRLVATDGHVLLCAAIDRVDRPAIIVDRDVLEVAVKGKPEGNLSFGPDGLASLKTPCALAFHPVDATYPAYERVIPTALSGASGQFNPTILARAQKALNTAYGAAVDQLVHFASNGPECAGLMTKCGLDALVVIMPWRADTTASLDWYLQPPEIKAAP